MTLNDQDAEVGRLVRERRELRTHLEALIARGRHIGAMLNGVGNSLTVHSSGRKYPSQHFVVEDTGVSVADQYHNNKIINGQWPTAEELREFLRDAEITQEKLAELETSLKGFGV
jgi:hypothetical protein